jgi:PleD family two-component response regulator
VLHPVCVDTQVLAMAVQQATGRSLSAYLEEKLWSRMGGAGIGFGADPDSETIKKPAAMIGSKILLVDDEAIFTRNMETLLEARGYICTGVNSGAEAIRELQEKDFDVVVIVWYDRLLSSVPQ